MGKAVILRDVWKARQQIKRLIGRTPLIYSEPLSMLANTSVYLKLENLHETDSFKIRGAANKILSLTERERRLGIVTFSTGNFAHSVAYLAGKLGMKTVVCISNRVPKAKVEKLKRLKVTLEIGGNSQDEAEERCYELTKEQGLTMIHPFDDPFVIAGHGTIGLEILEDLPETDTVIAGLSGGGLVSGLGAALKPADANMRLYGVSPKQSAAMYESVKKGFPITVNERDTLADSLLGGIGKHNRYTFKMVKKYVDDIVLVNEPDIAMGMALIERQHRMLVEGAAAAGIGALLNGEVLLGSHVVVIISGGSVDPAVFHQHPLLVDH